MLCRGRSNGFNNGPKVGLKCLRNSMQRIGNSFKSLTVCNLLTMTITDEIVLGWSRFSVKTLQSIQQQKMFSIVVF